MIQTGCINNLTYMTTVGISTAQTNDTLMIQTGCINNLTYMTTVGISTAQTNDTDWVLTT